MVLVVQEEAAVPASQASAGQVHPAAADLEGAYADLAASQEVLGQPVVADMVASQEVLEEDHLAEVPWVRQVVAEQEAAEQVVDKVAPGCVPAPLGHLALMPLFHPTATCLSTS